MTSEEQRRKRIEDLELALVCGQSVREDRDQWELELARLREQERA